MVAAGLIDTPYTTQLTPKKANLTMRDVRPKTRSVRACVLCRSVGFAQARTMANLLLTVPGIDHCHAGRHKRTNVPSSHAETIS